MGLCVGCCRSCRMPSQPLAASGCCVWRRESFFEVLEGGSAGGSQLMRSQSHSAAAGEGSFGAVGGGGGGRGRPGSWRAVPSCCLLGLSRVRGPSSRTAGAQRRGRGAAESRCRKQGAGRERCGGDPVRGASDRAGGLVVGDGGGSGFVIAVVAGPASNPRSCQGEIQGGGDSCSIVHRFRPNLVSWLTW